MALDSIHIPVKPKLSPLITVFGVGGAGCNAVHSMKSKGLDGVDFVVANTDAQSLAGTDIAAQIQLGPNTTQGLGAGSDPEIGTKAAEESIDAIKEHLEGVHMAFITAGMGGGTGTGAAPLVAKAARDLGILTVGVVTKPFMFEGQQRMTVAEKGIDELRQAVHTSVVIPNQNLFLVSNEKTTTSEAFMKADDVLYEGVKSITDLMVRPGRINLDFADVRAVMLEMGCAMMGSGEDDGEDRATVAAQKAMNNDLLEETRLTAAKGILINIIGGEDMTLFDLNAASETIRECINPDTRIIVGSTIDNTFMGKIKVTVLAAGLNSRETGSSIQTETVAQAEERDVWADEAETLEDDRFDTVSDTVEHDDEFSVDEVLKPEADWTNDSTATPAHAAEAAEDLVDELKPVAATAEAPHAAEPIEDTAAASSDKGKWSRAFVAPKLVNGGDDGSERQPSAEPAEESRAPAAAPPERRSARGRLRSVIRRMTSGSDARDEPPAEEEPPLAASEWREDHDGWERSDEERRVPAFMRRQAN